MKIENAIMSVCGNSNSLRPHFGPGMLLQHDDLEQITEYNSSLLRLVLKSLLGCGVICGLEVKRNPEERLAYLLVSAGLALDGDGHPISVPSTVKIDLDSTCQSVRPPFRVVLCRKTRPCAMRATTCDSQENSSVHTRESEGFEIRVVTNYNGPSSRELNKAYTNNECLCDLDCTCVLLAEVNKKGTNDTWIVDNSVRRWLRPVLQSSTTGQSPASATAVADRTTVAGGDGSVGASDATEVGEAAVDGDGGEA